MAPRARPGLRAGWAAPAGGSLPLKAGRELCVRCGRTLALCALRPTAKNYKIYATNAQHPQTPRCIRELRELGACAVAQPRRRERLAGARRERGVGASDNPRAASARRDAGGGQSRGGRRCGGGANNGGRDRCDHERAVAHNYSRGARRAPRQRANSATSTSEVTLWRHARESRCTTRRWWRCLRRRAWHAHLR